jgi:hypothetical protein
MPQIENILIDKALTIKGWNKLNDSSSRSIKVGYIRNCNDELIIDKNLKESIKNILKKYDIDDYELIEFNNKNEYSFDVRLKEIFYQSLKNKIKLN